MTDRRWAAWAALMSVLVLVVSASSCGKTSTVPSPEVLGSVFGVEASGCSLVAAAGSAVAVGPDLIATAAHTVAGADEVVVHDSSGTSFQAEVVALDVDQDLALLAAPTTSWLQLGEAENGDPGRLLVWSADSGVRAVDVAAIKRLRVTIEDIYVDNVVERPALEVQTEVASGFSGGAVVNADGEIIGIVYGASRTRSAGFAVQSIQLEAMLTELGPEPSPAIPTGRCVP